MEAKFWRPSLELRSIPICFCYMMWLTIYIKEYLHSPLFRKSANLYERFEYYHKNKYRSNCQLIDNFKRSSYTDTWRTFHTKHATTNKLKQLQMFAASKTGWKEIPKMLTTQFSILAVSIDTWCKSLQQTKQSCHMEPTETHCLLQSFHFKANSVTYVNTMSFIHCILYPRVCTLYIH